MGVPFLMQKKQGRSPAFLLPRHIVGVEPVSLKSY